MALNLPVFVFKVGVFPREVSNTGLERIEAHEETVAPGVASPDEMKYALVRVGVTVVPFLSK